MTVNTYQLMQVIFGDASLSRAQFSSGSVSKSRQIFIENYECPGSLFASRKNKSVAEVCDLV
jgi:hypothetical protein